MPPLLLLLLHLRGAFAAAGDDLSQTGAEQPADELVPSRGYAVRARHSKHMQL